MRLFCPQSELRIVRRRHVRRIVRHRMVVLGLIGVGVVYAQTRQYLGFEALHLKGLGLIDMIISQYMQKAMHDQMAKVISKTLAQIISFTHQRFTRHGDIAQNPHHRAKRLDLRKAQHIGGAVLAPPLLVQFVLLFVIGQQDRQLGCALDLGLALLERLQHRALGQRIDILRPIVVIADNGYFQW